MFTASAAATAILLGFVTGAMWRVADAPELSLSATSALVALALLADVFGVRALAVNRQVPREWGRLLGAGTAALLYGSRLGIGPLTILNSWTWWAGFVIGLSQGPAGGVVAGAVFALARSSATIAAGYRLSLSGPGH